MKYANGNATTAVVTVTAAAIPIVRPAIRQYVWSCQSVRKFPSPQVWTILPLSGSSAQNAEMNSTASAAT